MCIACQCPTQESDKEKMTFAMLDTCSQGAITTINLIGELNISGIQTSINIKTFFGHQKESSYIVEGLSVSKATVSDGHLNWIKLPSAFSKKKTQWIPLKSQVRENSR